MKRRHCSTSGRPCNSLRTAEGLLYHSNLDQAQQAFQANNWRDAMLHLEKCQWHLRGWEYRYLWTRLNKGKQRLVGHHGIVASVCFSPKGRYLAGAAGYDVKVWDAVKGQDVLTIKAGQFAIGNVTWNPDGTRLAGGCFDGMVRIWDAITGKEVLLFECNPHSLAIVSWSPDGKYLAGFHSQAVRIWDAVTGKEVLSLKGQANSACGLSWSPDCKRLVGDF